MAPITDYTPFLSRRCLRRQPSAIRVINLIAKQPGMISLGGGNPNADTFPFESMVIKLKGGEEIKIEKESLYQGLEYGPSLGLVPLINLLKEHQTRCHSPSSTPPWDIIVTSGSQDALNSLLLESPTYSGVLAALNPFACNLVAIQTDSNGLIPEKLEETLNNWDHSKSFPKVLYTIPTGQNPSGSTTTVERKRKIYEIACKHNLIILEDDPYYFLSFGEGNAQSYFSFDVEGRVVRFDSFSKILAGGIRLGWATGPAPLIQKMEFDQQAGAIHTSGLSQVVALRVLERWGPKGFDEHVGKIQQFYKERRDVFLALLDTHLKGIAEWSAPVAGMFVWIKLLGISDSKSLIMEKAMEKKVLLVPGQSFMPNKEVTQYARASYSTATKEQMDEALRRLADLIREANQ